MDVSVSFVKVYWNAKLVFAGGKFNGYGVTLKDFAREVCACMRVCSGVYAVHVKVTADSALSSDGEHQTQD